jgi:hypothetical protein
MRVPNYERIAERLGGKHVVVSFFTSFVWEAPISDPYANMLEEVLQNTRLEADEAWSFCYAKQVTVAMADERVAGDVWTWVAIDADTKLIPYWLLGKRDAGCAT